jgi:hypothetical protein
MEASEHLTEVLRTDGNHQREANRRIVRIATADPVPEAEHIIGVDTKLLDLSSVRRNSDKMFRNRFGIF